MAAPRPTAPVRKLFGRLSLPERNFVAEALRTETVGGVLLLVAAITALVWANIPALHDSYESVGHYHFGPEALGPGSLRRALGRRRAARALLLRRRDRAQA